MIMIIYVCMYVSMSLYDRVIRNHPCGGMISYAGEWHEEVLGLTWNQLRRVVMKNIQGQYHMVMSWYYVIILFLCYGQVISRDIEVKWKKCGLWHAKTSMGKTLEARLLSRDSVVLVMCGTIVVHMVLYRCWICIFVYIWCYVHVVYAVLCTSGVACILYIWRYIHRVLCA